MKIKNYNEYTNQNVLYIFDFDDILKKLVLNEITGKKEVVKEIVLFYNKVLILSDNKEFKNNSALFPFPKSLSVGLILWLETDCKAFTIFSF
jgi:hypothetical protein